MSRFINFYGAHTFYNPVYGTRCGTVPFKLFWLRYRHMRHVLAQQRLETSFAVAQGYSSARATKKEQPSVKRIFNKWIKEAFPEDKDA